MPSTDSQSRDDVVWMDREVTGPMVSRRLRGCEKNLFIWNIKGFTNNEIACRRLRKIPYFFTSSNMTSRNGLAIGFGLGTLWREVQHYLPTFVQAQPGIQADAPGAGQASD